MLQMVLSKQVQIINVQILLNWLGFLQFEVKIGDKLEVKAAGTVSMITRVYYDGQYMSTILNGTSTAETHLYTSTFNGYVAISFKSEKKLYLTITRAKKSQDNGSLSGIKWGAMGDSFTDPKNSFWTI